MKRVGISFDDSQRALVSRYADDKDETMPQAYNQLIQIGLYHSDFELELPRPEINEEMVMENSMSDDNGD